jgi:hypothetical protein
VIDRNSISVSAGDFLHYCAAWEEVSVDNKQSGRIRGLVDGLHALLDRSGGYLTPREGDTPGAVHSSFKLRTVDLSEVKPGIFEGEIVFVAENCTVDDVPDMADVVSLDSAVEVYWGISSVSWGTTYRPRAMLVTFKLGS